MNVIKIPLSKPIITQDMMEAAIHALQNEKLVMGESVFKFEEEFAKYIGMKYAVSTNSGTSALILAYYGINVKNFEVISPSATFISTINGAVLLGGKPVFAEIDLNTYTLDPFDVKNKVTSRTKAVVPVHLYGYPADLKALKDTIYENHKDIYIIEDSAQAHGAEYKGKKVGSLGDISIFSFYSIKNMTVGGDGGMLLTNDENIASMARRLRDVGRKGKYLHNVIGYVFRLNTVNAAVGRVQLRYLDYWNDRRREIASLYDKLLLSLEEIKTPPKPDRNVKPVYHLYVIKLRTEKERNSLGAWTERNGIQTLVHYPIPVHLQLAYRKLFKFREGILPRTEHWTKTVLSLPMFPELSNDNVKYVCEKIYEFYDKKLYRNKDLVKEGEEWLRRQI